RIRIPIASAALLDRSADQVHFVEGALFVFDDFRTLVARHHGVVLGARQIGGPQAGGGAQQEDHAAEACSEACHGQLRSDEGAPFYAMSMKGVFRPGRPPLATRAAAKIAGHGRTTTSPYRSCRGAALGCAPGPLRR